MINTAFPGGVGRWEVRRSQFRQGGLPHELLVLSDLSRPLREEERQAFQRLIRVIGHEMNNSLAPIKSIAGSLSTIIDRDPPPSDWREDVHARAGGHRVAVRVAEPLHERLRAAGEAAAAEAGAARRRVVRRSRRDAGKGAPDPRRSPVRRWRSRRTATSSNSC